MRLLVVDRESAVREVIEDLLVDHQIEVHQAADREQARRALAGSDFDALLCHLNILQEEGLQLVREARRTS